MINIPGGRDSQDPQRSIFNFANIALFLLEVIQCKLINIAAKMAHNVLNHSHTGVLDLKTLSLNTIRTSSGIGS
jgi:hypothetical protein